MPSNYTPLAQCMIPQFKQDPLSHYSPKEKLTLDPNYYLQNYNLNEERGDVPFPVNNLVSLPEKAPQKEKEKDNKERQRKKKKKKKKKRTEDRTP